MSNWARNAVVLAAVLLAGAVAGSAWQMVRAEKRARVASEALQDLLRQRLDSLERKLSREADERDQRQTRHLETLRLQQVAIADSLRRYRDGIPLPDTTVRDSLRYWHTTAEVAVAEVTSLRAALTVADSQITQLSVTVARVTAERDSAWRRSDAFADGVLRLQAELAKRPQPCRIIFGIPCPSRTTMTVAGALAGYALERERERRENRP